MMESALGGSSSFLVPVALDERLAPLGADPLDLVPDTRDKWLAFAPRHARWHPDAFQHLDGLRARPDLDLAYADDVTLTGPSMAEEIRLKPSPNLPLLVADDYIGTPLFVRASALHRLGGLRADAGTAGLYDLLLRAFTLGLGVERIPEVLLAHPEAPPRATAKDRLRVLHRWIEPRAHTLEIAPGRTPGTFQLRRQFHDFPEVTLVVPTGQAIQRHMRDASFGKPHIRNLLESLDATDWPMERLHVLVGDDREDGTIYADRDWPFDLRRILTPRAPGEPFNYARKMNALWRAAGTEHLVLMNDDVCVRDPGWLRALFTFAMEGDVGGAGARLLFPEGRIQHAGIIGGLYGGCAHAWLGQEADEPTYQDWALVHRDWSIVTGAVFATRRSAMEAVNGFDERLSLEFNDVDLCLRMRLLGYRIVYTPFAEMLHYEKSSRGEALPVGNEVALFLKRWQELLEDDPAYHPKLSRNSFAPAPVGVHAWWKA